MFITYLILKCFEMNYLMDMTTEVIMKKQINTFYLKVFVATFKKKLGGKTEKD